MIEKHLLSPVGDGDMGDHSWPLSMNRSAHNPWVDPGVEKMLLLPDATRQVFARVA